MHANARPAAATYADLEALPEHVRGEIVNGELHVAPRPSPRHLRAAYKLGVVVGNRYGDDTDDPGGWVILPEPDVRFGDDILVPDLVGWRTERLPELPDSTIFEVTPDWICEVLSPSTQRRDRFTKLSIYGAHGVPFVWLVHPIDRTVEVFEALASGGWKVSHHDAAKASEARLPPFDAAPLDLTRLWPKPKADAPSK